MFRKFNSSASHIGISSLLMLIMAAVSAFIFYALLVANAVADDKKSDNNTTSSEEEFSGTITIKAHTKKTDTNKEATKTEGKDTAAKSEDNKKDKETLKDKNGPKPWTLPNGKTMWESTGYSGPTIKDELKTLIAEKKYKLISTFDDRDGGKQYVYRFTFADGSNTGMNFSMPLDDVASWDDYQKKQAEQNERRHEMINQAIVSGRFRLLNLDMMQSHICRDTATKEKFKIQRIEIKGGKDIAFPRADFGIIPPSVTKSSWQDHLQAIRDGKRELLDVESVPTYTYQMTADDGTKTIFNYGGGEPLEKPDIKE